MKVCTRCHKEKPLEDFGKLRMGKMAHCKECDRKKVAAYREANLEKEQKRQKEKYRRKKNGSMKPRVLQQDHNAWRKTNPEKARFLSKQHKYRRRGLLKGQPSFTREEWEALKEYYQFRCLACDRKTKLTVDHIIPLSKGGSNLIDNIQPLCGPCNSSKGDSSHNYRFWYMVA